MFQDLDTCKMNYHALKDKGTVITMITAMSGSLAI